MPVTYLPNLPPPAPLYSRPTLSVVLALDGPLPRLLPCLLKDRLAGLPYTFYLRTGLWWTAWDPACITAFAFDTPLPYPTPLGLPLPPPDIYLLLVPLLPAFVTFCSCHHCLPASVPGKELLVWSLAGGDSVVCPSLLSKRPGPVVSLPSKQQKKEKKRQGRKGRKSPCPVPWDMT